MTAAAGRLDLPESLQADSVVGAAGGGVGVLRAAVLRGAFFAAVFLAAVLRTDFFAAVFFTDAFLVDALLPTAFLTARFLVTALRAVFLIAPFLVAFRAEVFFAADFLAGFLVVALTMFNVPSADLASAFNLRTKCLHRVSLLIIHARGLVSAWGECVQINDDLLG